MEKLLKNDQLKNDNAANRKSYVGEVYNIGERTIKRKVLNELRQNLSSLHEEGYIHIHDLDAYGLTYNCLTFNILNGFPYERFKSIKTETNKIVSVFWFITDLLEKMGNEQSGGMSFANFDMDFAEIFKNIGVNDFKKHSDLFRACMDNLVNWCNTNHTRMGQTSYYVTFNLGLGIDEFSRFLTKTLIESFRDIGENVYKPNIVFKVKKGINKEENDINFDLYKLALDCTSKKMIPTYVLCDSKPNSKYDSYELAIVGCRTRVVDDLFGNSTSIGRGNIANISINLPRLALEVNDENNNSSLENKIEIFKQKWIKIANASKEILLDRFYKTCEMNYGFLSTNLEYKLWNKNINDFNELIEVFKHGTLSIGFIGLSETIEVLTNKKYWEDENTHKIALDIVSFMRSYIDEIRKETNLNYSLLATSGELISGRFVEKDKQKFKSHILDKGFYTNSFHIYVDSLIPAHKKIKLEAPFHELSNGGCITYIELKESPYGNWEGIDELIDVGIESGIHYMGINFPKDVCNACSFSGVFANDCPQCHSNEITRIRRVSGYLEIQDFFPLGKKLESKARKENH